MEQAGDDEEHYGVLGLPSGEEGFRLSEAEIRRAYKRKAIELHPDKRPDDEDAHRKFQRLQSSYEVLKDDASRRLYDDLLRDKITMMSNSRQQERADEPYEEAADQEEGEDRYSSFYYMPDIGDSGPIFPEEDDFQNWCNGENFYYESLFMSDIGGGGVSVTEEDDGVQNLYGMPTWFNEAAYGGESYWYTPLDMGGDFGTKELDDLLQKCQPEVCLWV